MRLQFDALSDEALRLWIDRCRLLAVAAILALIALCLGWELAWAPSPPPALWALKALPLSLPLGGLLSHRLYTYRWLSLLIWLYVSEGAFQLVTAPPPVTWFALLEIALGLLVFASCVAYIQLRIQRGKR